MEPQRRSSRLLVVDLTGFVLPWWNGQPMLIPMPSGLYVPVFSTKKKAETFWLESGSEPWEKLKRIDNHREFVDSLREVPLELHLIVDPYVELGKMKWVEIPLRGPLPSPS
jgi:hypothetical protein